METNISDTDNGNWCRRLRTRKSGAPSSSLVQADVAVSSSAPQGEPVDGKVAPSLSPKELLNKHPTDADKVKRTPPKKRSRSKQERSKTASRPKVSSDSAPPGDAAVNASNCPPPSPKKQADEEQKVATSPLPETPSAPQSVNGMFTCVRCQLYTKDVGAFLQHMQSVSHNHEPVTCGDTKDGSSGQSGDLNSFLSLDSSGSPLTYDCDMQKPVQCDQPNHMSCVFRTERERKYDWRKPKMEDSATPGLKLHLTKHPLKANSWMARGLLSLPGEEIDDENGLLLTPEKTLEVTDQYLERAIAGEKGDKIFTVKEEIRNISRPVTPISPLLPKHLTLLPPDSVNPSDNDVAVLMERNNISIPPNCTTKIQGFKVVDGKKHLVLTVIPSGDLPSNTTAESQNSSQDEPSMSLNKDSSTISADITVSTCCPSPAVTNASCAVVDKPECDNNEVRGDCGSKQPRDNSSQTPTHSASENHTPKNTEMENHNGDADSGNWCRRLRARKSNNCNSSLVQADVGENNKAHQGEPTDVKIGTPLPAEKKANQQATDVVTTPIPKRNNRLSRERKKSECSAEVSSLTAPLVEASANSSNHSPPLPKQQTAEEKTCATPPLPETPSAPQSINGMFTCVRCQLYTKDVGAFLQHMQSVSHKSLPPSETKDGFIRQSGDGNSFSSLDSTGYPLKYECDTQRLPQSEHLRQPSYTAGKEGERKYDWRKPKMDDNTSPGLKLHLTKHPLKANSWMARGLLSLPGEEIDDENGLLLTPEKTLEVTDQYLERAIAGEKGDKMFTVKEEIRNISRPVTPISPLLPKHLTLLPPESVNPSDNDVAVLMEKNNISIPPNCATKIQGFKMVDGKKHLILTIIPAGKHEATDSKKVVSSPEDNNSNTTALCQNCEQDEPSMSVNEALECSLLSVQEAVNTCSPSGGNDASPSLAEQHAQAQCEDQNVFEASDKQSDASLCFSKNMGETDNRSNDITQVTMPTVSTVLESNELQSELESAFVKTASEDSVHDSHQPAVDATPPSKDQTDMCQSSNTDPHSFPELDEDFPSLLCHAEPDTPPASPPQPRGDEKEHSCTGGTPNAADTGETRGLETGADADVASVSDSGAAESVALLQALALSIPSPSPQSGNETLCPSLTPDDTTLPVTEQRIHQPPQCPEDEVNNQKAEGSRLEVPEKKRSREPSADDSAEEPASKSKKDVGSSDKEDAVPGVAPRHDRLNGRDVERTLRLLPFSCLQLIQRPQGDQPVVVLNHPDADIPEVASIMRVVHRYGEEVQRVVLSEGTLKALSDSNSHPILRNGNVSTASDVVGEAPPLRRADPRGKVRERFLLRLKLKRSGQNSYQVVNSCPAPYRCWFCGRVFTDQEDFVCHGQRHLIEANGDWNS